MSESRVWKVVGGPLDGTTVERVCEETTIWIDGRDYTVRHHDSILLFKGYPLPEQANRNKANG